MPTDTDTWISLLQLIVSIAGVVITIWLAVIVQRSAARLTELEFARAVRDTWLRVDDVTLRDPELIRLASQFLPPHETTDPAFQRKRLWVAAAVEPASDHLSGGAPGAVRPRRDGVDCIDQVAAQVRCAG